MRNSKQYVQFSKRIVVAVTCCVTMIALVGIVLCYAGNGLSELKSVVEVYVRYAMVVFVAYSGNSATEKWLLRKYGSTDTDHDETDDQQEG